MSRTGVRRLRSWLVPPVLRVIFFACRVLPWSVVQGLGRMCGRLAARLAGRDRTRSLDHLALAFPESDPDWRRRITREAFTNQLTNVFEIAHLAGADDSVIDRRVRVEGWAHVERARDSARPTIVITAHCGNWELLGAVFGRRRTPLAAVVRGLSEKGLEPVLARVRESFGTRTIRRGEPGAVRELLGALRGGTCLMMLIDQDIRTEGVWVPFFGRLAHTPVGAARLALQRNALVITAFMERTTDGAHVARFDEPAELPGDSAQATAVLTRRIEDQVRRAPAQWVWWHRRWRTAPPLEDDERVWRAG